MPVIPLNKSIENGISIVIPTYNRAEDLKDLLFSILAQTQLPKELIIVDDSENLETKKMIDGIRKFFSDKGIVLKFMSNVGINKRSSAKARNTGMKLAKGEIVLFLDDDVLLDKRYIQEILKVYEKYPNVIGVQGYLINYWEIHNTLSKLHNSLRKVFFLYFSEKEQCRVLPSGENTYPYCLSKVIKCQWFSGTNQSYDRAILRDYGFDENLNGYSFIEDMDLSYRLFRKSPDSLYMTPYAKLFHKRSRTSRPPVEFLVYVETVNRAYFFYKNIKQTFINKLISIWSSIGRLAYRLILLTETVLSTEKKLLLSENHRYLIALIKSYIYALKHIKEIKMGHLDFFDNLLLQDTK